MEFIPDRSTPDSLDLKGMNENVQISTYKFAHMKEMYKLIFQLITEACHRPWYWRESIPAKMARLAESYQSKVKCGTLIFTG